VPDTVTFPPVPRRGRAALRVVAADGCSLPEPITETSPPVCSKSYRVVNFRRRRG
jgi:hypothetical protein